MPEPAGFDVETLAALREEREIEVETSGGPASEPRRTVIWVVVDDEDRVLVRSWLGTRGRWYREARRHDAGVVLVKDRRLPVRFVPADDPARIEACSSGIVAKYPDTQSRWGMLREEILDTTMELVPLGR